MKRVAGDGEKQGRSACQLNCACGNCRPRDRAAPQESDVREAKIGQQHGQENDKKGVVVQRGGELTVQECGERASGSATGAIDMEILEHRALRIERIPVGRIRAQ